MSAEGRRRLAAAGPSRRASRCSPGFIRGLRASRGRSPGGTRGAPRRAAAPLLGALVLAAGCQSGQNEGAPLLRGDLAFARGDLEEALAEYRLHMRDRPDPEGVMRAAHVQARLGRVDEARALYATAVAADSVHALQAVSDLVARARDAFANGDSYGGASAMEAAATFHDGLLFEDLALPLARHYANAGQHGRSLPLYLRAMGSHSRNSGIVLEAALAHREIGDCARALDLFAEFVEIEPRRRLETAWARGACAMQLAEELIESGAVDEVLDRWERERLARSGEAAEEGDLASDSVFQAAVDALLGGDVPADGPVADNAVSGEAAARDAAGGDSAAAAAAPVDPDQAVHDALAHLSLVVRLGEPRTMLPQAHFRRAGILARMGECAAAVDAYRMVSVTAVAGSPLLADARREMDAIRFGEDEDAC